MIKPPRFGTCTQQRANQCDRKCDSDLKILECGIGITAILVSKPHEDKLGNTSLAAIVNARQRFICFFEKTVRRLRTFDMRTIGRCSDQSHAVFDGSIMRSHFCDMPGRTANVRYWGEIGLNADIGLRPFLNPNQTSAGLAGTSRRASGLHGTLNLCSVGRVQPGGWDKPEQGQAAPRPCSNNRICRCTV
jgi:hypothetical protein